MNMTRHAICLFILLSFQGANAQQPDTEYVNGLQARLQQKGVSAMMDAVQKNGWAVPYIPSQWHVEHVSRLDQKQTDGAAREFGDALAKQLVSVAVTMQQLPVGDDLYEQTLKLCALSDWCSSVDGYGNVLLAQRALDLAAVGVARLVASPDFPLDKAKQLSARMQPSWMSGDSGMRILNNDAGTTIFESTDRDTMEKTFGSGQRLLAEQRNPQLYVERQKNAIQWRLMETPEIKANLSFFDEPNVSSAFAETLVNNWNRNRHSILVEGLQLQTIIKAQALAEFRGDIGSFPTDASFTGSELSKIKEWSEDFFKKHQIKRVVTPQGSFDSLGEAAFAKAWQDYLRKSTVNLAELPPQRLNLNATAWQAYNEVKNGEFLDHDSSQLRHSEQSAKK